MDAADMAVLATESHSDIVIAATVAITAVSMSVMALRLYTRCFILNTAGSDDWTMLAAEVLALGTCISTVQQARYGLGRHIKTLTPDENLKSAEYLYGTILTYNVGLCVVKISFLLQYRRIFPSRNLRRICFWFLILIVCWTFMNTILLGVTCIPVSFIYPSTSSWCLATLPIWTFMSVASLISDFAIFVIPLPSLWKLPLPLRQKLFVCGIFGLGFFVCIVSIIRIPTLRAASSAVDPTWDNIETAVWTVVELNTAILCSSLPVLRPLISRAAHGIGRVTRPSRPDKDLYENRGSGIERLAANRKSSGRNLDIFALAIYDVEATRGTRDDSASAHGIYSEYDSAIELSLASPQRVVSRQDIISNKGS